MKDFKKHFFMLYDKFKRGENFAFSRFSDGELRIMQNKELILAADYYQIAGKKNVGRYYPEDHKHFDPNIHQFYKKELMNAYQHLQPNYFVGLSCRCCVGQADFNEMVNWYKGDPNSNLLTWSNLWVNGNFPLFQQYMIPEFLNKKIVYVLNENANINGLPFKIEKDFRIGKNCIINDYKLIDVVDEWISKNEIKNYVFLFSASSLSNFLIYQLFNKYPENTYIDIGTTLNDYLGMKGIRGYLRGGNRKNCIW
jgi:hypothetical protein